MKLYVCWDTRTKHPILGTHPAAVAHKALGRRRLRPRGDQGPRLDRAARIPQQLAGRREVRELSGGNDEVPALVLDSGEFIQGTKEIVAWAEGQPGRSHGSRLSGVDPGLGSGPRVLFYSRGR